MNENCESKIDLIPACFPPIKSGTYKIEVNHQVTIGQDFKPVTPAEKNFIIGGPRFSLSPSDIQSVFPPSNHRGNFDNCLPHVVLTRATLPWERTICKKDETIPWMALLLLDEKDHLKNTNLNVDDLLMNKEQYTNLKGRYVYIDNNNKIAESISEKETCTVIDISSDLFNRLVPAKEDLKFLAHSRKVDTQHKKAEVKDDDSTDNDGWFSVVVGNRLPASGDEGIKNTAHLVSLEGLYEFLPDKNGCKINSGCVRLISLASWSFFSIGEKYHFNDLARELNVGTFGQLDDPSDPTKTAQNLGYEKFNHITRMGKTIKSWYRGPFVPYKCTEDLNEPPHPCADAALRYDPETKDFDVSYAAAWQLGRLLALQNRNFAVAIFNWRRKMLQLRRIDSNKDISHEKLVMCVEHERTKDGALLPRSTVEKLEEHIENTIKN